MNSFQESKNELEAAIRYAENAISAAQSTIESMQFRQDMAKKEYEERTGREQALEEQNNHLHKEVTRLENENRKLLSEKHASSAPCGCQAYRDLEEARGRAEGEVELLQRTIADLEAQVNALEQPERATMPVIPKDVAIAIFREGVQAGVISACAEIEGQRIEIEEDEYCGPFEVRFTKEIDLDDELDLDWMRSKCGDYTEDAVIDSLKGLCADKKFECRIHGVDDDNQ